MKKFLLVGIIAILCSSCSMMVEEIPPLETTHAVSGNGIVSSVKNDNKETTVAKEVLEQEENAPDNELFTVLDEIKDVHPGTAGCSLKVLYAAGHLLNICKSKLPLDIMAKDWIEKQDKESYADIKESFLYLFENLKMIKETDAEKLFKDNDISDMYEPWDDMIFNNATNVIGIVLGTIG